MYDLSTEPENRDWLAREPLVAQYNPDPRMRAIFGALGGTRSSGSMHAGRMHPARALTPAHGRLAAHTMTMARPMSTHEASIPHLHAPHKGKKPHKPKRPHKAPKGKSLSVHMATARMMHASVARGPVARQAGHAPTKHAALAGHVAKARALHENGGHPAGYGIGILRGAGAYKRAGRLVPKGKASGHGFKGIQHPVGGKH